MSTLITWLRQCLSVSQLIFMPEEQNVRREGHQPYLWQPFKVPVRKWSHGEQTAHTETILCARHCDKHLTMTSFVLTTPRGGELGEIILLLLWMRELSSWGLTAGSPRLLCSALLWAVGCPEWRGRSPGDWGLLSHHDSRDRRHAVLPLRAQTRALARGQLTPASLSVLNGKATCPKVQRQPGQTKNVHMGPGVQCKK